MSQVRLLKNRFEKLDIASASVHHGKVALRSRSATCIDFSNLKSNEVPEKDTKEVISRDFQRQLSNSSNSSYKSIKRSPAFRNDAHRPKSMTTKIYPAKKKQELDELEYLSTSATIKKALSKPLPTGSPPKKPPRLNQFPKKENSSESVQTRIQKLKANPNTLPKKATKTENKRQIGGGLLDCIISPCSIDPIYYEQIRKENKMKEPEEELIYMEPYAHLKQDSNSQRNSNSKQSDEQQSSVHYMCTVLDPSSELSGNTTTNNRRSSLETTSDFENYEKVS